MTLYTEQSQNLLQCTIKIKVSSLRTIKFYSE